MSFHCLGKLAHPLEPGLRYWSGNFFFFSIPNNKDHRNQFTSGWQGQQGTYTFYLRSMSTLQSWAMVHRDRPHLPPHDSNPVHYVSDKMIHSCEPWAATSLNLLLRYLPVRWWDLNTMQIQGSYVSGRFLGSQWDGAYGGVFSKVKTEFLHLLQRKRYSA